MKSSRLATRVRVALTPLLILLGWHLLAASGAVSRYLLPRPIDVGTTLLALLHDGSLSAHVGASLSRVFGGFALSALAAVLLAGAVTRWRAVDELLKAPLTLLRVIPPLALTPLLMLWLGIGHATQLSIIVLASFFPVLMNACTGFRCVTAAQRELARSLNLAPTTWVTHVVLPAAVPSLATGLRLGFAYSWRALIGSELIAASSGLGYLIIDAQEMQRTDVVMVGILVIGAIGWALDRGFERGLSRLLARRFPEVAA